MESRKALGRGLAALMPEWSAPQGKKNQTRTTNSRLEAWLCPIDEVAPSPDNPRQYFPEDALEELAQSIKTQGLFQPLLVRTRHNDGSDATLPDSIHYVLIAGERRWRAANRAGLTTVPVLVQELAPAQAFERALVENVQRQDLNPMEEARAYQRLCTDFGYTQEQLAERVGRARETIANTLRLLRLPESVQRFVVEGTLSMGHARALLSAGSALLIETLARQVVDKQLSVRQTEALVQRAGKPSTETKQIPPLLADAEKRLTHSLNTRVRVVPRSHKRGRLEIHYTSLAALDEILQKLMHLSPPIPS